MASTTTTTNTTSNPEQDELQYENLPGPHYTRVLVLKKGSYKDDIACSLQLANLDTNPDFDALSYVWGNPTNTSTITCNGHKITVRANLSSALRRLRSPSSDYIIWVDALCINQRDLDERNAQVRIMADIYRAAKQVKVYLGEQAPDFEAALKILRLLTGAVLAANQSEDEVINILQTAYWRGTDELIPGCDSPDWDSFQDFFRMEYFERMWVIQETALAKEDPLFIYGDMTIPWIGISTAALLWHRSGLRAARATKDLSWTVVLIDQYRNASESFRKENFSLLQLLRHTRRCKATDPRDRIYALYGIASDMHDKQGKALLEPDYRASVEQVYRNVAAEVIRRDGDLDILAFCRQRSEDAELYLPSWVPDWTIPDVDDLPDFIHVNGLFGDYSGLEAGSDYPGTAFISAHSRRLDISGIVADEIRWVSEPMRALHFDTLPEFRENPGSVTRLWENVSSLLCIADKDASGKEAIKDAFWRTLIANMDKVRQKAGPEYYIHFLSWWRINRIADWQTEEHLKAHPDQTNKPSFKDRDAVMQARKKDQETGRNNPDQTAAIKRKFSRLIREYGSSCSGATPENPNFIHDEGVSVDECRHCHTVHNAELMAAVFPMVVPLTFKDPTYDLIDSDPFIAEWFARLRSDKADPLPVIDSEANQYANCLVRCARERVFFLTKQGRMGIGPPESKVGDYVAVITGVGVPFVVRRKDFLQYSLDERNRDGNFVVLNDDVGIWEKTFTLVGESYVHGIMDGSAVPVDGDRRPVWDKLHIV